MPAVLIFSVPGACPRTDRPAPQGTCWAVPSSLHPHAVADRVQPYRAVAVGADDRGNDPAERRDGGGRRMAIGVVAADLDRGEARAQAFEQRGQAGVLAAVMGDLEDVDGGESE